MNEVSYIIRKADVSDLERITEIYNQAIDAGYCTYHTERFTPTERMPWFEEHQNERSSILVYELENDVIGYSHISVYRNNCSKLNDIGELSCYVDFSYHGFGIAKKLMEHAIRTAQELGYTNLVATPLECNRESVSLLKKYNFEKYEALPDIVRPEHKYHSFLYYKLKL